MNEKIQFIFLSILWYKSLLFSSKHWNLSKLSSKKYGYFLISFRYILRITPKWLKRLINSKTQISDLLLSKFIASLVIASIHKKRHLRWGQSAKLMNLIPSQIIFFPILFKIIPMCNYYNFLHGAFVRWFKPEAPIAFLSEYQWYNVSWYCIFEVFAVMINIYSLCPQYCSNLIINGRT